MSITKWNLLNFVFDNEKADYRDVMTTFNIDRVTASMQLMRAHRYHWLNRKKVNNCHVYTLSGKAWEFYNDWGSFIEQPFYGIRGIDW